MPGIIAPPGFDTMAGAMKLALPLLLLPAFLFAQQGTVDHITVHGKSLEGNLSNDPADRSVSVYLPPSYKKEAKRRYPVVYFLHGFTDSDELWFRAEKHWINLPTVLDKALAAPGAQEAIVVMPDALTRFGGSMYSSSVTTGDWETFVARELVAYVDSHYRTLARAGSRGLTGHSMGGYGTIRIGMKFPEVFSSFYALSPCCLSGPNPARPNAPSRAESLKAGDDVAKLDFGTKAQLASAAAWSPNPKNPPFFLDLTTANGEARPAILAKQAASAPLVNIDQYVANLRRLRALAFDAGDKDVQIAGTIRTLDKMLSDYEVPHLFEIYDGNHVNHIADRIEQKVIPFFSKNLDAVQPGRRR